MGKPLPQTAATQQTFRNGSVTRAFLKPHGELRGQGMIQVCGS
jgi:hypothetical protein